jgi:aspartate kinase
MKFGGTSMAGIERIRSVASRVKREAERGNEVLVVVSAMAGETDRLVQLCKEASALADPKEYDVVVASGEQVTSGLLAMTLQNMGVKARSFMGWQLVRASGVHGNARVEKGRRRAARRGTKDGTVAVIPGFQGVSEDGGWQRSAAAGPIPRRWRSPRDQGRPLRHLHRRRRGLHDRSEDRAEGAQADQGHLRGNAGAGGVGAKVLNVRSVGLAMRENLPLRVLTAFDDLPGTEIVPDLGNVTWSVTPSPASPPTATRADHADGIADRPGHGRGSDATAGRRRPVGRHDRPCRDRRAEGERPDLYRAASVAGAGGGRAGGEERRHPLR